MPNWTVSFIDGVFQVTDADGERFPLTMNGGKLSRLEPGWTPRGLHTGVPPLHVLELEHAGGDTAFWFVDTALDYRGNAVSSLPDAEQDAVQTSLTSLAREIFDQAVLPRIAAVPAAAHSFDGFRPETVAELLEGVVSGAVPRPRTIDGAAIRAGGSFGSGDVQLPAAWVETVLRDEMPPAGADVLELGTHRAWRRFHDRFGAVSYLLQGADPADRHLYVPAANTVFTESPAHDPVLPLILWYATHVDRAVPLPEIEALGLDLIRPDATPHELTPEPSPEPVASEPTVPEPVAAPPAAIAPPVAEPIREPVVPAATADSRIGAPEPIAPSEGPGKQNWWKRLLGLGNP